MYKEILRSMEGVEVGAVVGFLIFFTFFLVMIIGYVYRITHQGAHAKAPLSQGQA